MIQKIFVPITFSADRDEVGGLPVECGGSHQNSLALHVADIVISVVAVDALVHEVGAVHVAAVVAHDQAAVTTAAIGRLWETGGRLGCVQFAG